MCLTYTHRSIRKQRQFPHPTCSCSAFPPPDRFTLPNTTKTLDTYHGVERLEAILKPSLVNTVVKKPSHTKPRENVKLIRKLRAIELDLEKTAELLEARKRVADSGDMCPVSTPQAEDYTRNDRHDFHVFRKADLRLRTKVVIHPQRSSLSSFR